MKKKIIALVLCMVLLVAASVTATMAYLTAEATVTNTFTVGNITMTMDETNTDGKDAQGNANTSESRDTANSYKLLPGQQYTKDPVIHMGANSEASYVIIYVDNQLTAIESQANGYFNIAAQIAKNGWTQCTGETNYFYKAVDAVGANGSNLPVFQGFTVAGNTVNSGTAQTPGAEGYNALDLANYNGKTIVVKAFAIQRDANVSLTEALAQAKAAFAD